MQLIHFFEAKQYENAPSCTAYEYDTEGEDINIARIEIHGRYPLEGNAVNETVKELVYVEAGEGSISVNGGKPFILNKGDVLCIDAGETFYWEGSMILIISCTPAWTPEQYRLIPAVIS